MKRLIDVDDDALDAARARLGTITIKDPVNEALCNAARDRSTQLASALSVLTDANLDDRSAAWSYDADFDHIASATGQPTRWIVDRGSID